MIGKLLIPGGAYHMRTCKKPRYLSGPCLGGTPPTTRLSGPRECRPAGTPKHQEGTHTILSMIGLPATTIRT